MNLLIILSCVFLAILIAAFYDAAKDGRTSKKMFEKNK